MSVLKIGKYIALLPICLLVVGCGTVDVKNTSPEFYDATEVNNIEVLKAPPSRPYVEVGTLEATGYQATETAYMHKAMMAKAAQLGADAIILTNEKLVPGYGIHFLGYEEYERYAMGTAIHYTNPITPIPTPNMLDK